MIPPAPSRLDDSQLRPLLESARTIAVVGLSPKTHRDSHRVSAYMQAAGYRIIPVTPKNVDILGQATYPDLLSVPDKIDIVNVFRQPQFVPPIAEQAVAIGAKLLWLQEGIISQPAQQIAQNAGLPLMEDSCLMIQHARLFGKK